jgi:hypothetical protein
LSLRTASPPIDQVLIVTQAPEKKRTQASRLSALVG